MKSQLYLFLFFSAFPAATLLPAQSEAVLAYQISAYPNALVYLIAIATAGNVLGAILNWALGRFFTQFSHRSWLPVSTCKLAKAEQHYKRYGRYSLLLSWVPFIGDPITVVAGVLREPLWSFFVLVAFAKGSRYIFVAALVTPIL